MAMVLITPPAARPVSLAEAKEYMKIENTIDDQLINDLIEQSVSHIQNLTSHKLITQSWRVFFDDLPENKILAIPLAPVIAPIEVRYYDEAGDAQVISDTDYEFDIYSNPARLRIKTLQIFGHRLNGLEVDVQVGFGTAGVDVPGDLIRAVLVTISHWYEFRGAVHPDDQPLSTPASLNKLLAPYRKAKL